MIAVVGENGAGKATLVKLLCGFYTPSAGTVSIDGTDLRRIELPSWRARLAGTFHDFFRFEYPLRQAVGLGDLARLDGARVAEYGSHEELMALEKNGTYAELYGIQASAYRSGYQGTVPYQG